MKRYLLILALCGSVHAEDLGPLDSYWAARGWYREQGSTVYHRGYDVRTQIIVDEVKRDNDDNQEQLDRIEEQQKEILRRLKE